MPGGTTERLNGRGTGRGGGRSGVSEKYDHDGWVPAPPVSKSGSFHERSVPTTRAQPRRLRSEPNSRRGTRSDIRRVTDSYLGGTTDSARPRLRVPSSPSLSDVDDDPASESYSWLELEPELKPDDEVRRGTSESRRGQGLEGERRCEGGGAGAKLTAGSFFFTGG